MPTTKTTKKASKQIQKRDRGTGSLKEVRPGVWDIRVNAGKKEDGKRHVPSKRIYGTFSEASKALIKFQREANEGTVVVNTKQTVAEFIKEWADSREGITEQTRFNQQKSLENHLYGTALGRMVLTKVERTHVQLWIKYLYDEKDLKGMVGKLRQLLSQGLDVAVLDRKITSNPVAGTKLRKLIEEEAEGGEETAEDGKNIQVLSREEITKVLNAAKATRHHALWTVFFGTGLRPQELLPLRWSDLAGETLQIRRVVARVGGKEVIQVRAKTKKSIRDIALPTECVEALKAHKAQQDLDKAKCDTWEDNDFIFAGREGKKMTFKTLQVGWENVLKAAEVKHRVLYSTRHTHITLLIEAGVPDAVIAERCGNSATIVQTYYTHIQSETLKALGAKAQAAIFGNSVAA
jgi:integrase